MTATTRYTAANLADVAEQFEARGAEEDGISRASTTQRDKVIHDNRAGVWRTAARMLRQTALVPAPLAPPTAAEGWKDAFGVRVGDAAYGLIHTTVARVEFQLYRNEAEYLRDLLTVALAQP